LHGTAILLCAAAPALATLSYGVVKTRSRWNSEALWEAYFVGAVCALAALVAEISLNYVIGVDRMLPLQGAALGASIGAAIPEEVAKFVGVVFIAVRHVDARRMQDTILLSLAVALGFATLEDIAYLAIPGEWTIVALERAITAVPGHGIDGLTMGALATLAQLRRPGRAGDLWALALALPILFHTAYDFPLLLGEMKKGLGGLTFLLWLIATVPLSILAVCLVNSALRVGVAADRRTGRDSESRDSSPGPAKLGMLMLFLLPVIVLALLFLGQEWPLWQNAALTIVPAILAIDLLFTGWRKTLSGVSYNAHS
jgi:RsiW-degrading membrane proteinase PrsW (M82 family)